MSHEEAKAIILQGRGSHFDPMVIDAFLIEEQNFIDIAQKFADEESAMVSIQRGQQASG